jgi:hypothetical protein
MNEFEDAAIFAMIAGRRVDAATAQKVQDAAPRINDLLIWTVYERPDNFPDSFICRPFSTLPRKVIQGAAPLPLDCYLEAATLAELRMLLPAGLTLLTRSPGDDPKIVETWL